MSLLWAGFMIGFAGSMHCILMCGPLVLSAQPGRYGRFLYQGGRIFSYLIIGLVFGAIGKFISLFFYQQVLSVISGLLLLTWVCVNVSKNGLGIGTNMLRWWSKLTSGLWARIRKGKQAFSAFGLGVLNGFLPCGLVYMAAAASLNQGNLGYSMLFMILFGLGTLPAILAISFSRKLVPVKWHFPSRKLSPVLLTILGLLFILRGLNLGVPFLSPSISYTSNPSKPIPVCCAKTVK